MKNINVVIIIIFLLGTFFSCESDLDPKLYSSATETTYNYSNDDIYAVIGNSYQSLRDFFVNSQLSYWCIQEATTDEIVMPANNTGWDNGGEYKRMHWHKWNSQQRQFNNFWNAAYISIISSTRIISQLSNGTVPVPKNLNKLQLISEMRTVRAFNYWLLMDNFGDIPLVKNNNNELASKTSRKEVFEYIVTELTEAIPKLSEKSDQSMYGRFNKWGAKTLLANVYLNAEVYVGTSEWDKCIKECDDIINSNRYELETNYKDIFKVNNNLSPEIIFAIPFDIVQASGWNLPNISLHAASKATFEMQSSPFGAGSAKAIPEFINLYDQDDERLSDTWLMGQQYLSDGSTPLLKTNGEPVVYTKALPDGEFTGEYEGFRTVKFEIEPGYQRLENDFPFFRYAQILLMKAECLLRNGQTAEAEKIVSKVRQRAFRANPEKATVKGSELLANSKYNYGYVENYAITDPGNTDAIKFGGFYDELGREFASETYRRRDMIRFDVFTKKSWLSHVPVGDYTKVYPLPQISVDANPELEQNPDY